VLTFATFPQAEWFSGDCGEDLHWLPERFFIVSNQFWKHKNHTALFEALQLLAARNVRPIVVCTGRLADFRDADYADTILQSLHRFGIAQQVVLLGMIARRTQIELMRRSLAVVQPSLFEGWSTVVEDARVLGKPVILSDIAVHQEQNPPGAHFFPRDSAAALADSLEEAWRTLTPGPHLESEAAARTRAEQRITEVGRRFLEIARAS
jgi:glycosyltransferase involved in cell wall biosynthesis